MRLEQFKYLMAIHEKQSINLASQKLHISQQSISKAIQNLEEELQTTLLYRTTQGTTLTDAGQLVLHHAENIFSEIEALQKELSDFPPKYHMLHGTLHLLYNNAFDYNLMLSSVNSFRKNYTHVNFTFQQRSLTNILEMLSKNLADIGMISVNSDFHLNDAIDHNKLSNFSIFPFLKDTLIVAVSNHSSLSKHHSITMNTILKQPLILYLNEPSSLSIGPNEPQANWLIQLLQHHGKPNFVMQVNTLNLYIEAIIENSGVGFLTKTSTRFLPQSYLEKITLLPVRPAITLDMMYLIHSDNEPSPLIQAYLPHLNAYAKSFS